MKWIFICFFLVYGGWGEWSNYWFECSMICGLGMWICEWECDNFKFKYGGRLCEE